jgi:hypothetical protein
MEVGIKFSIPFLIEYAEKLTYYTDYFEIENMKQHLNSFNQLVEQLKNKLIF